MKLINFVIFSILILIGPSSVYAKSCYSDFNCGMGAACVKQPFKNKGVCMQTTNNYGVRTYNSPSTNSLGTKTSGSCTFNTDCPIGFKCDRKYKECIKR